MLTEAGWSAYPDSRAIVMGDLWDSGGAYSGEYQARDSYAGLAHVVNAPNGLWLRTSPQVLPDNGITRMPNNSQVVWYEDVGGGWARVEFYGTVGYASTTYLEVGPARAGHAPAPIPPYEPPAPPAPSVIVPPEPPPEPAPAEKKNTLLYVVGAVAAAAAAYYFI